MVSNEDQNKGFHRHVEAVAEHVRALLTGRKGVGCVRDLPPSFTQNRNNPQLIIDFCRFLTVSCGSSGLNSPRKTSPGPVWNLWCEDLHDLSDQIISAVQVSLVDKLSFFNIGAAKAIFSSTFYLFCVIKKCFGKNHLIYRHLSGKR